MTLFKIQKTLLDIDEALHAFSRPVVHHRAPQADHHHQHLDHLEKYGDEEDEDDDDNDVDDNDDDDNEDDDNDIDDSPSS